MKTLFKPFFILTLFFFWGGVSYGADVNCLDCQASTIEAALQTVKNSGGGIVYLPSCDTTYSPEKNFHIPWGVSIEGNGKSNTILRDAAFTVRDSYGIVGDYVTRIGNMSIYNGEPVSGSSKRAYWNFRNDAPQTYETVIVMHDMHIEGRFSTFAIVTRTGGLVYNVDFNLYTSYGFYVHGVDDEYFDNTASNDCANTFGTLTQYTFVVEDTTWEGFYDHLMDARTAGSYIFRYNTVTYTVNGAGPIETHGPTYTGTYETPDNAGGNRFEIYNNIIQNANGVSASSSAIFLRGGCWLVYNNNIRDKRVGLMLQIETSPSWPCSNELYPIYHQPKSIWIYNNTFGNIQENEIAVSSESNECIKLNRDYYLRAPSLADDGFTYTPYTYPHPLRNQVSTRPLAPTGLTIYDQ